MHDVEETLIVMPILKGLPLALALLLFPGEGLPQPAPNVTIELREIDPGASVLPLQTRVYGRIAYTTDAPVRLVLHPYREGRPITDGVYYSGSPEHPAPAGEAVAWFAFGSPQTIDEVRAIANDVFGHEFASASEAHTITWRPGPSKPPVADWVAPLQAQSEALSKASAQADDGGFFGGLLVELMFLSVPLSLILQVLALRMLDGTRLRLAKVSALVMAALWLFVIVTGVAGSNLSPIWLVFLCPLFVVFLSVLLIQTYLSRRRAAA